MKQITFRFANPTVAGTKFTLDVQAISDATLKLFGINFRMFYDTKLFQPAYPPNYPNQGDTPKYKINLPVGYRQYNFQQGTAPYGNSSSGMAMFGASGPVTYLNGAVELTDPATAREIYPGGWSHVLQLELEIKDTYSFVGNLCPVFIWDKKPNPALGGFMVGSEGLNATEYTLTDAQGVMRSASLIETGYHMNWSPDPQKISYPWGLPNQNNCFKF